MVKEAKEDFNILGNPFLNNYVISLNSYFNLMTISRKRWYRESYFRQEIGVASFIIIYGCAVFMALTLLGSFFACFMQVYTKHKKDREAKMA